MEVLVSLFIDSYLGRELFPLTFKMLSKIVADDILLLFLFYFIFLFIYLFLREKARLGISCELGSLEILSLIFSEKEKKKKKNLKAICCSSD